MTVRPGMCPHCGEEVESMRPYQIETPPDARERTPPPTVRMHGGIPLDSEPTFDILDCLRLAPCGHFFPEDAFELFEVGEITGYELGDRVLNPASR